MNKRDTLLIVSGEANHRKHLRTVFEESFNLLEAVNIKQFALLLEQNHSCIAAVLADATSIKADSAEAFFRTGANQFLTQIPRIVFTKDDSAEYVVGAFSAGATDVMPLYYDSFAMQKRVQNIVELHLHKRHLEELVEEQASVLRRSNLRMVDALSAIIEYRSAESGQHILRIRHFTQILLEEVSRSCPEYGLTGNIIEIISSAAALHDVGKISIPDAVLNKPGRLEADEWEIMKTHTLVGCKILENLQNVTDEDYLRYAYNICRYHHERWDGNGYPEGLAGDDIPICAQVVGLADAYDALTTERVYKKAVPFATATNMILRGECGAFSGKLLECFRHVSHKFEELALAYADGLSPNSETFDPELPEQKELAEVTAMDAVQAKLLSMMHFTNALVAEVDPELQEYHLLYNPYPELAALQAAASMQEAERIFEDELVMKEDRARLVAFHKETLPAFVQEGRRRRTGRFLFRGLAQSMPPSVFAVTLIRMDPGDEQNKKLLIIWEKEEQSTGQSGQIQNVPINTAGYRLSGEYLCAFDSVFTLLRGGSEISKLVGYSPDELNERFHNHLVELVLPEDRQMLQQSIREQLDSSPLAEVEFRVQHKDGHTVWLLNRSRVILGPEGEEALHSVLTDITVTKQEIERLQKTAARYEIILSQTENVLFEWDMQTDSITFSDTWKKIFGYDPLRDNVQEAVLDRSHIHPDDVPILLSSIRELKEGSYYKFIEMRIATAAGRYLWCRMRATAPREADGTLKTIYGVIINIDEEKRASQQLRDRAERDALTKLLNKEAARNQVEEYLRQSKNGAMLIIDLDDFKGINDTFGHMFGDAVLMQIAKEIKKIFRAQDVVARIGGDEFFVFMQGLTERKLIEERCGRLVAMFRNLLNAQLRGTNLSCSIGVALAPTDAMSYVDLFQYADQALYQAKAKGKNTYVFYDSMRSLSVNARKRAAAAKTMIDSDERPGLANDSLIQYSFERLYTAEDVDAAVNELLKLVGEQMKVSRVYVFENNDDNTACFNTYEWCAPGISPEINNLQGLSYETDIPGYEDNFDEQGMFYCPDVRDLPQSTYEILEPQGIKSMLQCAIRDNGVFRGYVGFDACEDYQLWTQEQVDMLTYFSEMLAVFLLKRQAQKRMLQQMNNLYSILNSRDTWMYVTDPQTGRISFLNDLVKQRFPEVKEGSICYQVLMGRNEPCENCPMKGLKPQERKQARIDNAAGDLSVMVEATTMDWNGEQACLVTCRTIDP